MVAVKCDWCGKEFTVKASRLTGRKHIFCSRECVNSACSKTKNPDGYKNFRDTSRMSENMASINRRMNKDRMTPEVRQKLSQARRKPDGDLKRDTYKKRNGRHEHRAVAEEILGRSLKRGEVVHHINGDRHDNRPENLLIFKGQGEHVDWHRTMGVFDPITGEQIGGD